jgi:hypothetical protein
LDKLTDKLRILVTGFEPFPGAPYNPTQPLVRRLARLHRPALADVELSDHIFPDICGSKPAPATPSPRCGPMPTTRACARDRSPVTPTR